MDPTELVREFIEYYRKGNYVEATESAFDLLVWMEKGGFDPDWSSVTCFDRTEAPPVTVLVKPWNLRAVADQLEAGASFKILVDTNGNSVVIERVSD